LYLSEDRPVFGASQTKIHPCNPDGQKPDGEPLRLRRPRGKKLCGPDKKSNRRGRPSKGSDLEKKKKGSEGEERSRASQVLGDRCPQRFKTRHTSFPK